MVRSILRNIAKNKLKDMGVGNVNQKMHFRFGDKDTMPDREMIAKYSKTPKGRAILAKAYKEHPALWTEVLNGSKKKEADDAFQKMSNLRKRRSEIRKLVRKNMSVINLQKAAKQATVSPYMPG